MTGLEDITRERARQVNELGYTAEHDDRHGWPHLAIAGSSLAWWAISAHVGRSPLTWPAEWRWNPGGRREAFVKAGALIAAAIDALDREEARR